MDERLPHRHESLQRIYASLEELVSDLGAARAAQVIDVSPDTVRRRIRGSQPWFFEEIFRLARHQISDKGDNDIAKGIVHALTPAGEKEARPLLLPSNLREMLRVVGRCTTEIADTLDDGRVDGDEAKRLIDLFEQLDGLVEGLRHDLDSLIRQHG